MIDSDRKQFADLLTATMELFGSKLSAPGISLWWGALTAYPIDQVRAALSAHVRDTGKGMFPPKPADIIAKIQSQDGRMGPEEAWAHVAHAIGNELVTLVLTEEEQQAFFVADALADDRVAARMAFKEAYVKAVSDARTMGIAVTWVPMLGHDAAGREAALNEAVRLGRIGAAHADKLLPYRHQPAPAVAALLEHRGIAA